MLQRQLPHGQKSTALNVITGIVARVHNAGGSASIGTPLPPFVRLIHRSRILSAPSRHNAYPFGTHSQYSHVPDIVNAFSPLRSLLSHHPPVFAFSSPSHAFSRFSVPCFSNYPTPFTPSSLYFILYTLTSLRLKFTPAILILTITLPLVPITICLHTYILQANVPSVYPVPVSATNASTIV